MEFTTVFGLHSQATRLYGRDVLHNKVDVRAWHPPWAMAPFKRDLVNHSAQAMSRPKRHISLRPGDTRFSAGLFPFRSPLLRESLLVSFPPLINMLKFSG